MKKFRFLLVILATLMGVQSVMAKNQLSTIPWQAAYYKSNQCQTPPPSDWYMPDFDDSSWGIITGPITDEFQDRDAYWCRQWIHLADDDIAQGDIWLDITHDDEAEVYINGVNIYNCGSCNTQSTSFSTYYVHAGWNLIAVYCNDSGSCDQYLDFRLYTANDHSNPLQALAFAKSDTPTLSINKTACTLYVTDQENYNTANLNVFMLTPEGISDNPVTWTSSNPSVASVSNGKVTAVGSGNTTITAEMTYGGKTYTKSCDVKVISFAAGEKVVFMPEAGCLSEFLTQTEIEDLTKLTIFGNLNGTDVRILRAMAGRDHNDNATGYSLQELDLTNANFVYGGESYMGDGYSTEDNVLSHYMFQGRQH